MVAKTTATRHPLFPAPPPKRSFLEKLGGQGGVAMTCHAKINLFLHVTNKRDDGYHELQSWVAFAETGDVVRVRAAKHYHLAVEGPFAHLLPPAADNIITKTVNALAERHGRKSNVVIELTKNLPVGTGLGGGSANAAATARALQHLWDFEWVEGDEEWLAKNIGADVPACLLSRTMMMEGIGQNLRPTPHLPNNCNIVIVYPGVGISTREVFGMLVPPYTPHFDTFPEAVDVFDLVKQLQETRNDLMHPAMGLQPKIIDAYRALTRQTGCLMARMTGSGTACFGIFPDDESARAAANAIRKAEPQWWVRPTRLLAD